MMDRIQNVIKEGIINLDLVFQYFFFFKKKQKKNKLKLKKKKKKWRKKYMQIAKMN